MNLRLTTAVFFLVSGFLQATHAAEGARPVKDDLDALQEVLDETVVTGASKRAETSSVAPATVTVITAEDLNRYGIHSLDDALNFLSLGMVTQNPLHSVEVGARGVLLSADFGNHVLLLLNGHVLNEQWDGTAYFERGAAIPWELIDHIEVILGPGSVLYGSNAMLGVINVVTRRARDYGTAVVTVDGDASSPVNAQGEVASPHEGQYFTKAGGAVRVAAGGSHTFQLFSRDAEVIGQIEYYTQRGPSFTFGPQDYGTDSITGAPKNFGPRSIAPGVWGGLASQSYATQIPAGHVRFTVGDLSIELRAATYTRSTPYTNLFNQFFGDFDNPANIERDRFLNLDIRYRAALARWLNFSARGYGALYDFRQDLVVSAAEDCVEGQTDGCLRRTLGYSRWLGLELQGSADWALDGKWLTLLGADGRLRRVGGETDAIGVDGSGGAFGAYGRNESVLGLYLQQEAHPLPWLSLNAGARLDLDSRFGSRLSPRAAVAARVTETSTVKVIYAEAFRAPTAYELYYSDPTLQIAASNLKPETVRSVEGSWEQRLGLHRFLIGGFWSRWSEMVLQDAATSEEIDTAIASGALRPGVTSAVLYRNLSSLDNFGGNLAVDGSIARRFRYALNFTLAHTLRRSAVDGSTLPLTVAPQLFGNVRASYDLGGNAPTLALAAFFTGSRPVDRAFDGGWVTLPYAPPQVQLRATVSGPLPWVRGLSYRASLDYSVTGRSAYVAGPLQAATPDFPAPQLAPVDRLRLNLQILERLR